MTSEHPAERVSSIESHPKIAEWQEKGIKSKTLIEHVLIVYLQLIEMYYWFDVETIVDDLNQLIFITGRKNKKAVSVEYVLPVLNDEKFTWERLDRFIGLAKRNGSKTDSVTLAFIDTTSTVSFYSISNGLVPPKVPTSKDIKKLNKNLSD